MKTAVNYPCTTGLSINFVNGSRDFLIPPIIQTRQVRPDVTRLAYRVTAYYLLPPLETFGLAPIGERLKKVHSLLLQNTGYRFLK